MKSPFALLAAFAAFAALSQSGLLSLSASAFQIGGESNTSPGDFPLGDKTAATPILTDTADYPVVQVAANLFAEDMQRVTDRMPAVNPQDNKARQVIIAGTLGHSALIDKLAAAGKLKSLNLVKDKWEATSLQLVKNPMPGVDRALVIVGSDRRGTAYGFMQLSQAIGVSPWVWWADVPPMRHEAVSLKLANAEIDSPGVKYRGIFINDEDWGLNPWASRTFDPQYKNIGPKTYEKVFELMLRLRLNYIWPAMHACSAEFGSDPANYALADKYGIVAGASHCEPMLFNNVHWKEADSGKWNYSTNQPAIHNIWETTAKARGADEAVWTIGIRGIHDAKMETPPNDMPGKISVLTNVFNDQEALINQYASKEWGSIAECFVPYKEVLPIYDAGLQVPPEATLIWVDDNFGYIRRLSGPAERKRPGGAGVYWHISYFGSPHSYTWINTTAPALMWEELHKAWENGAGNIWMLNVGDIKPMEIGIDYYSKLAWAPDKVGPQSQPAFLKQFATETFDSKFAMEITDLLSQFYQLGTIRKPELMNRAWDLSLSDQQAAELAQEYKKLLDPEYGVSDFYQSSDSYFELIDFPAHILADTGLIFMADRQVQLGRNVDAATKEIAQYRADLKAEVEKYNKQIAGGKWNLMMPGLETNSPFKAEWSTQVRWPWNEKNPPTIPNPAPANLTWRAASSANSQQKSSRAQWTLVSGLGTSGSAVALLPVHDDESWNAGDTSAPALSYYFKTSGTNGQALIDFLPTYRLYPGKQLRVAVSVDNNPPIPVEVPASNGKEDERGTQRADAVQDNYVRATVPLTNLTPGNHKLKISAMDPGAVVDRISLPSEESVSEIPAH